MGAARHRRQRPPLERLMERVNTHDLDKCWECPPQQGPDGYYLIGVRVSADKYRSVRAHRLVYEAAHGPIPDGYCICHACDNRACVNPLHLFAGTQQDNIDDMIRKGRHKYPTGERNGQAKLTDAEVLAIRASSGSHTEIAAMYGVSRTYVNDLRNGRKRVVVGVANGRV